MHKLLLILSLFCLTGFKAQLATFELLTTPWQCNKGTAQVRTNLQLTKDSVKFNWSTGQSNQVIGGLETGEYSVKITYTHKKDTLYQHRDTTLWFSIEKKLCYVVFPKYFSPNGDNYNDLFLISNIDAHPNFELTVYNKWGQRVHHQQQTFEPWDGTWLGVDLPDGTYYYVFLYNKDNTSVIERGDITILR